MVLRILTSLRKTLCQFQFFFLTCTSCSFKIRRFLSTLHTQIFDLSRSGMLLEFQLSRVRRPSFVFLNCVLQVEFPIAVGVVVQDWIDTRLYRSLTISVLQVFSKTHNCPLCVFPTTYTHLIIQRRAIIHVIYIVFTLLMWYFKIHVVKAHIRD